MKVFDETIRKMEALLGNYSARLLPPLEGYPTEKEKVFLFPEDAYCSLGGRNVPSSYSFSYTSDPALVAKEQSYLIGKDLPELSGEVPFVHAVMLRLSENEKNDQELYGMFRRIEYTRYSLFPAGYMVKVNTNQLKEGALVGFEAKEKGLNFAALASLFASSFRKEKSIVAVKQYFVTDPSFPYGEFASLASSSERIIVTLDHIMKKLVMDCSSCEFKGVCDEIEGMRELHKKEEGKR